MGPEEMGTQSVHRCNGEWPEGIFFNLRQVVYKHFDKQNVKIIFKEIQDLNQSSVYILVKNDV